MLKKPARQKAEPAPCRRSVLGRVLVYALAFTLFAVPLVFFPGVTEYGYGKTIVALVAISILSLLWSVSGREKEGWNLRIPWITLPFLGFVAASLLSLLGAVNGRIVVQTLVLSVVFFQLLLLTANVIRERRDVTLLLGSITLSAFLASLYALLQYLGVVEGAPGETGIDSIISSLGNRNFLGGFLAYLLLHSCVLTLRLRSRAARILSLGAVSFNFGTLVLVQQVAPMVGLLSAVAVILIGLIAFRLIEPIRRNRWWLLSLLALLVAACVIGASSWQPAPAPGPNQDQASWVEEIWIRNTGRKRELDWWIGWEMLKARPLTGVGLGNYKVAFLEHKAAFLDTPRGAAYADLDILPAAQAHNDYVQVAAELGSLGLLAVLALLGVFVAAVCKRLSRNPDEADRLDILLYAAGIAVFLVHALASFPAHLPASMLAIVFLLGLIHAPVYGKTGLLRLRLRRRASLVITGALAVIGAVVSVFAVSDLAANVLMGKGLQQLRFGDPATAVRTLEQSIRLDFAPRQTYFYLATAQVQLDDQESALENYEKCFTRCPDENLYLIYANIAWSLGRLDDARIATEFLLSINPRREIAEKARYIEGMIAVELGDYGNALQLMTALAADAPEFDSPVIALGHIYSVLGRPDAAQESYTLALELIDRESAAVESALASGTNFTADEYYSLCQAVARLQNVRAYVLEQLAVLTND